MRTKIKTQCTRLLPYSYILINKYINMYLLIAMEPFTLHIYVPGMNTLSNAWKLYALMPLDDVPVEDHHTTYHNGNLCYDLRLSSPNPLHEYISLTICF